MTSFERIHRANLVGMGVLPLTFRAGESVETFGLDGTETFDVRSRTTSSRARRWCSSRRRRTAAPSRCLRSSRSTRRSRSRYYRHGGILNYVLRDFLQAQTVEA